MQRAPVNSWAHLSGVLVQTSRLDVTHPDRGHGDLQRRPEILHGLLWDQREAQRLEAPSI